MARNEIIYSCLETRILALSKAGESLEIRVEFSENVCKTQLLQLAE